MRHSCTVVVVVTVILFSPTGVRQVSLFHLYDVLTPTVGAESVQRSDGKLAETVSRKNWRAVCYATRGRWLWFSPSSLWWLFCRYVCVSCVDAVLQCVQCASCACRGRSHHYRARNGDAATMCVCVCLLAAPLCISLLPFFSPLSAQIRSPASATLILLLLLLLLARVRGKR
ncbi:hypothetical protein TCDM_10504 [Trypanosoma cruzi Dm28c]|uniref:Mucin TcMUCII n=1 Tax=Trypanosoma cruzi Dm28c TaxID=1416333 RepID=V5B2P8_TRYCR|nr:hypothetical protein TCDM_10504 [Trypanosoma cruzi Dm28c]